MWYHENSITIIGVKVVLLGGFERKVNRSSEMRLKVISKTCLLLLLVNTPGSSEGGNVPNPERNLGSSSIIDFLWLMSNSKNLFCVSVVTSIFQGSFYATSKSLSFCTPSGPVDKEHFVFSTVNVVKVSRLEEEYRGFGVVPVDTKVHKVWSPLNFKPLVF